MFESRTIKISFSHIQEVFERCPVGMGWKPSRGQGAFPGCAEARGKPCSRGSLAQINFDSRAAFCGPAQELEHAGKCMRLHQADSHTDLAWSLCTSVQACAFLYSVSQAKSLLPDSQDNSPCNATPCGYWTGPECVWPTETRPEQIDKHVPALFLQAHAHSGPVQYPQCPG